MITLANCESVYAENRQLSSLMRPNNVFFIVNRNLPQLINITPILRTCKTSASEQAMGPISRVRSFVQQKFDSVQDLDVHDSWVWVLTNAQAVNPRPGDPKKRLYVYNSILSIWFILNSLRFVSVFAVSDDHNAHLYGHTYARAGWAKIISVTATIINAQCCLYRMAMIRFLLQDAMIIMKTLGNIVNERDRKLRTEKKRMARLVLLCAVVTYSVCMIGALSVFTAMQVMNILSSKLAFEKLCWLFWWVQDILNVLSSGGDVVLFAAMWLLIAINYRIDIVALEQEIDDALESDRLITGTINDDIRFSYMRLVRQAVGVNRMCSVILFSLVLCTTPFFCTALFAVEYGENLFISVAIFTGIIPLVLIAWTLLAIAGEITSLTEGLHGRLCSLAAKGSTGTRSFLTQRIQLQHLLEQTGSEEELLALRTIDGQKYTSESLLYYLIDTGLQYTLLLTFDRSMKLQ